MILEHVSQLSVSSSVENCSRSLLLGAKLVSDPTLPLRTPDDSSSCAKVERLSAVEKADSKVSLPGLADSSRILSMT